MSLEAKVGLFLITAGAILGVFLLVLADVQLEKGYPIDVDFNNPGSVQEGSLVRLAGLKIGKISKAKYLPEADRSNHPRALVRMRLSLDKKFKQAIHRDAIFYVTSQGLLGEQYIAVDPGSQDQPSLEEGTIVRGIDPPRLDLAIALGYELLDQVVKLMRENKDDVELLVKNAGRFVGTVNALLTRNQDHLDQLIVNLDQTTAEAKTLVHSIRTKYVDAPEGKRIWTNLDTTLRTTSEQLGPLITELHATSKSANEALQTLGPEQRTQLKRTLASLSDLSSRAETTLKVVESIALAVREGKGTIGSLVMDDEVYDDLQELVRDLKHNPWKLFWKQ